MFGKREMDCTQKRQDVAVQNYIDCEQDIREFDKELSERDLTEFVNMSDLLFGRLFTKIDRDVYYGRIVPKHGPGSTADGLTGNGKFNQQVWPARLNSIFSMDEHLVPNPRYCEELEQVDVLEPGAEVPVKVTLVPKTLKTPRVIAMEPTCMQYMQQGILRSFLEHFYKDDFLRSVIGFDDQVPNQELARQGSLDQRTATLDLSDASDRVSFKLVLAMLQKWPHLRAAIDASRSRRAELPDGTVMPLRKFASMGSALCFPIEAIVFTTMIFVGIQRSLNSSLIRRDLFDYVGSVRVYGDDLIIPVEHVLTVVKTLELFGASVGLGKSFWTGKFRESCGKEYFNGHDVSLTRVRQALPAQRQDATAVQSLVSFRNLLYWRGYWGTCKHLDEYLKQKLWYFPIVEGTSTVLGRESVLSYQTERTDPFLQSPLVKGWFLQAEPPRDHLEGSGALLKCLLKLDSDAWLRDSIPWHPTGTSSKEDTLRGLLVPEVLSDHLERFGRPKSTNIKLGWRQPF